MKRAFIVHGWGGEPTTGWKPWLKAELEKKGFTVVAPQMVNTQKPVIAEWVQQLSALVGKPDEQTYFIGHSLGCQAIIRYVESLPQGSRAGGLLLIAGFLGNVSNIHTAEDETIIRPWRDTPVDTEKVKRTVKNIHAIFSPTDIWIPVENKKIFEERLGAKTVVIDGKGKAGHFASGDGVNELPEALNIILDISAARTISIDEFSKMEIKMGKILSAEKIPGADKLYKLSVDMGAGEVRTIASGVAQFYAAEELVGKVVPVIANLAPRVLRGVESKGMILMADNPEKGPTLLTPIRDVPPGSIVK